MHNVCRTSLPCPVSHSHTLKTRKDEEFRDVATSQSLRLKLGYKCCPCLSTAYMGSTESAYVNSLAVSIVSPVQKGDYRGDWTRLDLASSCHLAAGLLYSFA